MTRGGLVRIDPRDISGILNQEGPSRHRQPRQPSKYQVQTAKGPKEVDLPPPVRNFKLGFDALIAIGEGTLGLCCQLAKGIPIVECPRPSTTTFRAGRHPGFDTA